MDAHLKAAAKALKAGELDEAFDAAKLAMKQEGGADNPKVHVAFGAILSARGDPEMAEKAYRSALEIDSKNQAGCRGLAALLEADEGRADELLALYEECERDSRETPHHAAWLKKRDELRPVLGLGEQLGEMRCGERKGSERKARGEIRQDDERRPRGGDEGAPKARGKRRDVAPAVDRWTSRRMARH